MAVDFDEVGAFIDIGEGHGIVFHAGSGVIAEGYGKGRATGRFVGYADQFRGGEQVIELLKGIAVECGIIERGVGLAVFNLNVIGETPAWRLNEDALNIVDIPFKLIGRDKVQRIKGHEFQFLR